MPSLQEPYDHEPVPHVPVTVHKSVATPERPSYKPHYCYTVGDILSTLQRLIADNPKLAEDAWFVDGDDGTINFQNHYDYIS